MALLSTRKSTPRKKGIARRQQLLRAARALLETHELDDISLGDVAAAAHVPKSSAYHFYADIKDVYASLLAGVQEELLKVLEAPIRTRMRDWRHIVEILTERGVDFYAHSKASMRLQIDPRIPVDLKLRDRRNDAALGSIHEQHIDRVFVLPGIPNRAAIFFRAVGIADLMFMLSVLEHGRVTPEMAREAQLAMCAYLGCYLPPDLPRRRRKGE
ncbi:MAG: TetR family transcriptional regulator [Steroidobacteraceae bacterium]